jgi:hypothetical protein
MFDITDWMEVERESDPPASAPGPQSEPTGEKMKEERKRNKDRLFSQHSTCYTLYHGVTTDIFLMAKGIRASKLIQSDIWESSAG